ELQGNLSQRRRQEALDGFKDGTYHVLVATDIAARGIDVARVSHVINFDFPDTPEAYTHRIGRTGRAQRSGKALTFVTENDFGNVLQLERQLNMRVTRERVDGFAGPDEALERLGPGHAAGRSAQGRSRRGGRPGGRSGGSRGASRGPAREGGREGGAREGGAREGSPRAGDRQPAHDGGRPSARAGGDRPNGGRSGNRRRPSRPRPAGERD